MNGLGMLRFRILETYSRAKHLLPSKHRVGAIFQTPTGEFAIPMSDVAIGNTFRKGEAYGDDEIERILERTKPDDAVLFVGGHIGSLAIPVAKKAKDVTIVEANPNTFRYLAANVALNRAHNITLHEFAAGEEEGAIEFVQSARNTGGSKRKPKIADPRYYYDNPQTTTVKMHRLDDVLEPRFDVIVMDIEGSEYFALNGMPCILRRARMLVVEFEPHHIDNVSNVTVDQFRSVIGEDFDQMFVPETAEHATGAEIVSVLKRLHVEQRSIEALIFTKSGSDGHTPG